MKWAVFLTSTVVIHTGRHGCCHRSRWESHLLKKWACSGEGVHKKAQKHQGEREESPIKYEQRNDITTLIFASLYGDDFFHLTGDYFNV